MITGTVFHYSPNSNISPSQRLHFFRFNEYFSSQWCSSRCFCRLWQSSSLAAYLIEMLHIISFLGHPYCDDWALGVAHQRFRRAAHEDTIQTSTPVSAHNDRVDSCRFGELDEFVCRYNVLRCRLCMEQVVLVPYVSSLRSYRTETFHFLWIRSWFFVKGLSHGIEFMLRHICNQEQSVQIACQRAGVAKSVFACVRVIRCVENRSSAMI